MILIPYNSMLNITEPCSYCPILFMLKTAIAALNKQIKSLKTEWRLGQVGPTPAYLVQGR